MPRCFRCRHQVRFRHRHDDRGRKHYRSVIFDFHKVTVMRRQCSEADPSARIYLQDRLLLVGHGQDDLSLLVQLATSAIRCATVSSVIVAAVG